MTSSDTAVRYIQRHYQPEDWLGVVLIKRGGEGDKAHIKQEFLSARSSHSRFSKHEARGNLVHQDCFE